MSVISTNKSNRILLLIITAGIILFSIAIFKNYKSANTFEFRSTEGIITQYRIDGYLYETQYGTELRGSYFIAYKYNVNSQDYYSTIVSYDVKTANSSIGNYSLRMEVEVFYNEEDPSEAVLVPALYNLYANYYFAVGFVFVVGGLIFLFINYKYKEYQINDLWENKTKE